MRQADAALQGVTAGEPLVPVAPARGVVPAAAAASPPKRNPLREQLRAAGFSAAEVEAYLRGAEGVMR